MQLFYVQILSEDLWGPLFKASKALKMKMINFELESKLDLHFDVKFDGESDGDSQSPKSYLEF